MLRIPAHHGIGWEVGADAGAEPVVAPPPMMRVPVPALKRGCVAGPIKAGAVDAGCVAVGAVSTVVAIGATSLGAVAGMLGTV